MRRWPLLLLSLALVACSAQMGGPPGGPGAEQGPADDRVLIDSAPVALGEVADHLVTTGLLESERQADLVPEATGITTKVLVEEGDTVKAGQLLAVLANPNLEGAAARAGLELDRARQEAERVSRLYEQGVVSASDQASSQATLRTAEASYQEATRARGFTRIEAPFDGVVSLRDLRVGEVAGGRRAFQVVDLSKLRVVVQLPEKDLNRAHEGQPAVLEGAYDAAATAKGKVLRLSPVVDPTTGTARVTIEVEPGQTALRPGQFVKVRLEVDRHRDVVTIPRSALVWEDGEPVAFRVDDAPEEKKEEDKDKAEEPTGIAAFFAKLGGGGEGPAEARDDKPDYPRRVATKVRLEIGYSDPERVEIKSGLKVGDPIITVGTDGLRDGTAIRLPGDPPPKKPGDKDKDKAEDGKDQ